MEVVDLLFDLFFFWLGLIDEPPFNVRGPGISLDSLASDLVSLRLEWLCVLRHLVADVEGLRLSGVIDKHVVQLADHPQELDSAFTPIVEML